MTLSTANTNMIAIVAVLTMCAARGDIIEQQFSGASNASKFANAFEEFTASTHPSVGLEFVSAQRSEMVHEIANSTADPSNCGLKHIPGDENRRATAVEKGNMLANLYIKVDNVLEASGKTVEHIRLLVTNKLAESKSRIEDFKKKIQRANRADKHVDRLSGYSSVGKWQEGADMEEEEVTFYGMIMDNVVRVHDEVSRALLKMHSFSDDLKDIYGRKYRLSHEDHELNPHKLTLDGLIAESDAIAGRVRELEKQWKDATKDYNCGAPPQVNHVASICKTGNTKYSPKCAITCQPGFNGVGTKNVLKCRKQGKFGRQVYGEWQGMAICVGKSCGLPPDIVKADTTKQVVRYPHASDYDCSEGFSQDGLASGSKAFSISCGVRGFWEKKMEHECKPVRCGMAPFVKNSKNELGKRNSIISDHLSLAEVDRVYYYADVADYNCTKGHTTDETPGGLTTFSVSCQATGVFSQTLTCNPIRCGPPPTYEKTDLWSPAADKYFEDEVSYKCQSGYTLDQKADGVTKFALTCRDTGEFAPKGKSAETAIPQCQPVGAGEPPKIAHATYLSREMFYGENVVVTAETGYSTVGHPTDGLSYEISVSPEGKFVGVSKFLPVVAGSPPRVKNAKTTFKKSEAVYGDMLSYNCTDGYSTDAKPAKPSSYFTLTAEADSSFSAVPGVGECVNIDDCADHTCGPFGECVDKLKDYECACKSGYEETLNNKTSPPEKVCGNIDDCGPEACGVGECKDLVNTYKCLCPTGFEEVEEAEGRTCKPKLCGVPPEVKRAVTSPADDGEEKTYFPKKLTYQCETGYTLDGTATGKNHFDIKCQASTEFTATQECLPVKCETAPTVANGAPDAESATFNQTIRYQCQTGFTIDATAKGDNYFSTTCQATGNFGEVSECKRVSCGEPDEIPNAARPGGSMVYEDKITYECFDGFTLNAYPDGETKFKIECLEDGSLTKTRSCFPKICGEPPKDIHARHATTANEGKISFPRKTEVTCEDGYTVGGDKGGNTSFIVTCKASGKFERYDPRECMPVRCGPTPTMKNATLKDVKSKYKKVYDSKLRQLLSYGERLTYNCLPGFTTGGEPEANVHFNVDCNAYGEWSAPPADMQCRNVNDCEENTCGPNGMCIDEVGPAPAYTCKCNHGFDLRTTETGHKHCGNTDDCQHDYCGVGVCKDLIGDYTCICPSGYYIGDKDDKKTCIPVRCVSEAPVVKHARRMDMASIKGPVDFPATLEYQCDEGYSSDSSLSDAKKAFQMNCKSDGMMGGNLTCQPVSCGSVRVLPFTKITWPKDETEAVVYKTAGNYECFEGYTVGGVPHPKGETEFLVKCQSDGVMTLPKICEPVKCGEAPRVPKSRAAIAGDVMYGMHLEYHCDTGYSLDATPSGPKIFQRSCLKNASFSEMSSSQPCKPVSAGDAPVMSYALMTEYAGEKIEETPGQLQGASMPEVFYPNGVEYRCLSGYSENGASTGPTKISAKVNSLATFTPPLPKACTLITYAVAGIIKDAKNGAPVTGAYITATGKDVSGKVVKVSATSEDGYYKLVGVVPGNVTFVFSGKGFIETKRYVTVEGHMNVGGPADISMSPVLAQNEWRAVLKWGAKPRDLDAYARWGWSKVCSSSKTRRSNNIIGVLEKDVTRGFGPETLMLRGIGKCTGGNCDVRYEVNVPGQKQSLLDVGQNTSALRSLTQAHGSDLRGSGAVVTLYQGDSSGGRVIGIFKIADCAKAYPESVKGGGNWWHVFTLNGKNNTLKWSCLTGTKPPMSDDKWAKHEERRTQQLAAKKEAEEAQKLATGIRDEIKDGIKDAQKAQAEAKAKIALQSKHDETACRNGDGTPDEGCCAGTAAHCAYGFKHTVGKACGKGDKFCDAYGCKETICKPPDTSQEEALDKAREEEKFYKSLKDHVDKVIKQAETCIADAEKIKKDVDGLKQIDDLDDRLDALTADAKKAHEDMDHIEKQWADATKDHPCGTPPKVNRVKSMCKNGGTRSGNKCEIKCADGYDGLESTNLLRCRMTGKFGKKIYGEWQGTASCIGRMCGKPPYVAHALAVVQDIRYPHSANYMCEEGYSMDQKFDGPTSFAVPCADPLQPCDTPLCAGTFGLKPKKHVCNPISCGKATVVPNAYRVQGEFFYTDPVNYKCKWGYTVDGMTGGLAKFSTSCQATGAYSQPQKCIPVRCGLPPVYENTDLINTSPDKDKVFKDELVYKCQEGYSTTQKKTRDRRFKLVCMASGEFAVKQKFPRGKVGESGVPVPKCQPIYAGMTPTVEHGNAEERKMYYGDTEEVTAEYGYTLSGETSHEAKSDTSFTVQVGTDGSFKGLKKFRPVRCPRRGAFANVLNLKHASATGYFVDEEGNKQRSRDFAVFGGIVEYQCMTGHSTDGKTESKNRNGATQKFSVECQGDGTWTRPPGLGECKNIDDCGSHSCGAHGKCVDLASNRGGYSRLQRDRYTCKCDSGFEMRWDHNTQERVCGNINDCGSGCGGGKCEDLVNGYQCHCYRGFRLDFLPEGQKCVPKPCPPLPVADPHGVAVPSDANSKKHFTGSSFSVQCNTGFTTDSLIKRSWTYRDAYDQVSVEAQKSYDTNIGQYNWSKRISQGYNRYSVRCNVPNTNDRKHADQEIGDQDPEWFVTEKCMPTKCNEAPTIPNGKVVSPMHKVGKEGYYKSNNGNYMAEFNRSVRYECDPGYTIDGTGKGDSHFSTTCLHTSACTPELFTDHFNRLFGKEVDRRSENSPWNKDNSTIWTHARIKALDDARGDGSSGSSKPSKMYKDLLQCQGQFSDVSECKPISCGEPDEVPNGLRPSGSLKYKESVKYKCSEGFTLDGSPQGSTEFEVACLEDGTFTKLRSCLPKVCGEPPKDIHAMHATTADEGRISYPRLTEVTCQDGFTVGGDPGGQTSFVVKCEKDGKFQRYDPRECEPVRCGSLGDLANATKPVDAKSRKMSFANTATYDCLQGFTAGGEADAPAEVVVECTAAGLLQPPPEDQQCRNVDACEENTCGPHGRCVDQIPKGIPKFAQRQVATTKQAGSSDSGRKSGSSATGEQQIIQKYNPEEWVGAEYTCDCNPGFELVVRGRNPWCGNVDDCAKDVYNDELKKFVRPNCGAGNCVDLVSDFTCDCPVGYYLGKKDSRKTCIPVQCAAEVAGLQDGRVMKKLVTHGDFGSTWQHKCERWTEEMAKQNKGSKRVVGKAYAKCKSGGNNEMCKGRAGEDEDCQLAGETISFPGRVWYQCDKGHSIDGSYSDAKQRFRVSCKSDGVLFGMQACQRIICGSPRVLPFTDLVGSKLVDKSSANNSWRYGDIAKYRCQEGYTQNGKHGGETEFSVECGWGGHAGLWSSPKTCEPVQCGQPPYVPKSRPAIAGQVSYSMRLQYFCDAGYTLDGTPTGKNQFLLECGKDGKFSKLATKQPCKPISGGPAPTIENAVMTEYAGKKVKSFPPTMEYPFGVEYKCKPGYSINGVASGKTLISSRMTSSGYLTPSLPAKCRLITYSMVGTVRDARSGKQLSNVKITVEGKEGLEHCETVRCRQRDSKNWVHSRRAWSGLYKFFRLSPGKITLKIKPGRFNGNDYYGSTKTVDLSSDIVKGSGLADIELVPKLRQGKGEWRTTLKWGAKPLDLDANAKWGLSSVSSTNPEQKSIGIRAVLQDDAFGKDHGPEILYLSNVGTCDADDGTMCDIRYEVSDLKTKSLKLSNAEVTLERGPTKYNGKETSVFKIADCPKAVSKDGAWWHVATIDGKTNKIKWSCKSGTPAQPAWGSREYKELLKKEAAAKKAAEEAAKAAEAAAKKAVEERLAAKKAAEERAAREAAAKKAAEKAAAEKAAAEQAAKEKAAAEKAAKEAAAEEARVMAAAKAAKAEAEAAKAAAKAAKESKRRALEAVAKQKAEQQAAAEKAAEEAAEAKAKADAIAQEAAAKRAAAKKAQEEAAEEAAAAKKAADKAAAEAAAQKEVAKKAAAAKVKADASAKQADKKVSDSWQGDGKGNKGKEASKYSKVVPRKDKEEVGPAGGREEMDARVDTAPTSAGDMAEQTHAQDSSYPRLLSEAKGDAGLAHEQAGGAESVANDAKMSQEDVKETQHKLKEIREVSKAALKVIKKVSTDALKDASKAKGEDPAKKMMETTENAASTDREVQAALARQLGPIFKEYETGPEKPSGNLEPMSLSGETSLETASSKPKSSSPPAAQRTVPLTAEDMTVGSRKSSATKSWLDSLVSWWRGDSEALIELEHHHKSKRGLQSSIRGGYAR